MYVLCKSCGKEFNDLVKGVDIRVYAARIHTYDIYNPFNVKERLY